MQHLLTAPTLAILFTLSSGLATLPAHAQPGPPDRCPPRCGIVIEVPENPEHPPTVDVETLAALPGQEVTWESNRPVLVVFPEQTPFVGPSGRPIFQFNVRSMNRLRIRNDSDEICSPPGCKYMVIDLGHDQRPPLDPYVIIER